MTGGWRDPIGEQLRMTTYSTAVLHTLVCPVMLDRAALQAALPDWSGLQLAQPPQVPDGRHPVIIEVWSLRDGLMQGGDLNVHDMWEMTGNLAGLGMGVAGGGAVGAGVGGAAGAATGAGMGMWLGPVGMLWGTAAGAAAGAMFGAAMLGSAGATRAAQWASQTGRQASVNNSRRIGSYNEVIVTVPSRRAGPDGVERDFAYVMATYTDNPMSIMGERLGGWGFGKSPAFGEFPAEGRLEVKVAGRTLFQASRQYMGERRGSAPLLAMNSPVVRHLSQPLLGTLPCNRLMVSCVDRYMEDGAVEVSTARVSLQASEEFLPGLGALARDVVGYEDDATWGAFLATGTPIRLSHPRRLA